MIAESERDFLPIVHKQDLLSEIVKITNKEEYENFWLKTGKQLTKIEAIEKKFLSLPQVPCSVIHKFGPGIYIREVTLPQGSICIGHHQNFEHMNIFIKGRITILDENGQPKEIKAPMTFVGKPGRKIGYIHEDSVWLNVYPTSETNIEKLEAHYLTKSDSWIEDQKSRVGLLTSSVDKSDYELVLKEFGVTEDLARKQSENKDDMTELPYGNFKIKTGPSKIEGTGLFATADIMPDEIIAPARINGKRTIAGRYPNHSAFPNAKMFANDFEVFLVAVKKISGCHGGQDGEEITVNYRDSLRLTLELGARR